jgi:hypothetical protein
VKPGVRRRIKNPTGNAGQLLAPVLRPPTLRFPLQVHLDLVTKEKRRTMISPVVIVLAVLLPLLLLLIVLLGILLLRSTQLRASDLVGIQWLKGKCAELEQQLAAFPKAWRGNQQESGFLRREVSDPYLDFQGTLNSWARKWIGNADSGDLSNESAARIEALLFPEPPPTLPRLSDRDMRVFPNPHHYTSAEIYTLLKKNDLKRRDICQQIMSSIILHAISIEGGDPLQSLLPLGANDIVGLAELKTLIRGAERMGIFPSSVEMES